MNLNDTLKSFLDSQLSNIHTALPGVIVEYDNATQKAIVRPVIKKKYRDGEVSPLPRVTNVPVVWPRAGGASLTFPMVAGDGVLLIFSERSIANWLLLGGEQEPADFSKFSINDAMAIPGLNPFSTSSLSENNTDVLLTFGDNKIRIEPDGTITFTNGDAEIKMTNANKISIGNSSQELLDLFNQTLAALIASIIPTGIGAQQLSKVLDGTMATIQTDLGQIKT